MPDLFGLDIAGIVNDAITDAGGLVPLTLTVVTSTEAGRTPGSPSAGRNPTTTGPHAGQGIIENYDAKEIDGTLIQDGDRKVLILGASLPTGIVPKADDTISIESFVGLRVVQVMRDPAAATYECQVRG